jgi:membrane-bound lytic murein transglycosylase D
MALNAAVLAFGSLAAGCASGGQPEVASPVVNQAGVEASASTSDPAHAQAPESNIWNAGADLEGVDEARVSAAQQDASEIVDAMDTHSRSEFHALFGDDPLGLETNPANAARYSIPLETNEAVEKWIDYFQNRIPERFTIYLERLGRYEAMIQPRLYEAGLPDELIYLAMIESGMNPNAYSRAHAVGMWQFIKSTGRMYDLEISYWVDDRRDPMKATDAAISFLSDLHDEFGSWYLAAAAYNGGPARVRRGIRRTGSDDFWDLADARVLRRETRNYVPKLLAAATIARDPAAYGFTNIQTHPPMEFEVVEVPDATSFDVLAEVAETDEATIKALNPQYVRNVTPPDRTVELRVPPGSAAQFAEQYAMIPPSERVTWLVHTVTRGQTLGHIAGRYGTSVEAIRAANNYVNPKRLQIGQELVIPRSGKSGVRLASGQSTSGSSNTARSTPKPDGPLTVTVQRGDTLWTIARRYNVTTRDLMAINNLSSSRIYPGDRLTVSR